MTRERRVDERAVRRGAVLVQVDALPRPEVAPAALDGDAEGGCHLFASPAVAFPQRLRAGAQLIVEYQFGIVCCR